MEEVEQASDEYEVQSLPTFMVFKDGKKVDFIVGGVPDNLQKLVTKHSG